MLDDYISTHGLKAENLSVGYVYTATGDSWYHNPDKWYYSASTYKVPVDDAAGRRKRARRGN